jgi:outer membrane autotransporter protein
VSTGSALLLRKLVVVFALLAGASALPPAAAQSLDDQYLLYLYAKCEEMNFERDGFEIVPGQAGPQLFDYCNGSFTLPFGVDDSPSSSAGFSGTAGLIDQAARRRKAAGDEEKGPAKTVDETTLFESNQASAYFSLNYAREEQDATRFEGWHRSNALGLMLGLDRRLGTKGVIGLALQAEDSSGDLDSGGSIDHHAYGLLGYGSWLPTADSFIDVGAGWTSRNVDTRRIVALKGYFTYIGNTQPPRSFFYIDPAPASSDVDQQDLLAELRAGYDFTFGRYAVGPRVAGSFRKTDIDAIDEAGPTPMTLAIGKQVEKSLRTGAGLQASSVFNTSSAVWVAQLNADWWREFKDDQRVIKARLVEDLRPEPTAFDYQNQPPDRSTFTARASLSVTMPRGWSAFTAVDALLGHRYISRYGAAIGLRKEL